MGKFKIKTSAVYKDVGLSEVTKDPMPSYNQ